MEVKIEAGWKTLLKSEFEKDYFTKLTQFVRVILQFAHHLGHLFHTDEVYAEAYVCMNGSSSRLLINPKTNLAKVNDSFSPKKWILAQAN
jgi:hypothetical protein